MPPSENSWKRWLALSGIGLEMGVVIYLGHRVGLWIANYWGIASKIPQISGTFIGVGLALYLVLRQTKKLNS